jgi:hypothetical protein
MGVKVRPGMTVTLEAVALCVIAVVVLIALFNGWGSIVP